jgi:hypothetical protein
MLKLTNGTSVPYSDAEDNHSSDDISFSTGDADGSSTGKVELVSETIYEKEVVQLVHRKPELSPLAKFIHWNQER